MRFFKCIVKSELTDKEKPKVILPNGIFKDIEDKQIIVATMRKDDNKIILHPIKEKIKKIYEIYCEIKLDYGIIDLVGKIKGVVESFKGIIKLDISDGICEATCSYDAFFGLLEDFDESEIDQFVEKLKQIRLYDSDVIHNVIVDDVK